MTKKPKIYEHAFVGTAMTLHPHLRNKKGGLYVHVYRNLNRNCWSVRHNGKVLMLADSVKLEDCSFHIQPAGQMRVRRDRVKNVHAYIKGRLTNHMADDRWSIYLGGHSRIEYNPYHDNTFVEVYQTNTAKYRHGIDLPEYALSPIMPTARHWSQVQFHSTGQVSGDPW